MDEHKHRKTMRKCDQCKRLSDDLIETGSGELCWQCAGKLLDKKQPKPKVTIEPSLPPSPRPPGVMFLSAAAIAPFVFFAGFFVAVASCSEHKPGADTLLTMMGGMGTMLIACLLWISGQLEDIARRIAKKNK